MSAVRMIWTLTAALMVSTLAMGQSAEEGKARADLEKQLWGIEQKWVESARTANADFLRENWSDQFFEVASWPPGIMTKPELLARVAKRGPEPTKGPFPSDFKLQAVYGNFALATDLTTVKGRVYNGKDYSGEYRGLRLFVKENGKWRIAGSALVPISSP
jgi:Domain of unknown function (DUF4440)